MEVSKKKHKRKILSSMFHTKKQRKRKHQADSGHDDGLNITPTISKTPSIVLSVSSPIISEQKRDNKKHNDPIPSSSVLTPSQQIQLLTVSSPSLSHEPFRTRSTSRMSSMSSLHTGNLSITSLRSAYSNGDDIMIDVHNPIHNNKEQAPSIIRSDRVHRYHFETPTHASHHNNEDGASSRFSYNATRQLESSSLSSTSSLQNNYYQHQQPTSSQRHTSPRFAFKRPYFSSSFSSFHRRKSLANTPNNNRNSTNVSITSSTSTSRRVARSNNILFMGRSLPDFETLVYCSFCEKWIHSRLRYRSGAMVWLAAFVLLMCTVIFFWIPFYTKYFKDIIHYCPACGCQVGRHNAL